QQIGSSKLTVNYSGAVKQISANVICRDSDLFDGGSSNLLISDNTFTAPGGLDSAAKIVTSLENAAATANAIGSLFASEAANLIFNAAGTNGISPWVILATLEKEQ